MKPGVYKVLKAQEALKSKVPIERVLVDCRDGWDIEADGLELLCVAGVVSLLDSAGSRLPTLHSLSNSSILNGGDVIRVQASGQINVLFRRGANANSLFITENCNSLCIMCSQPPRRVDDLWRISEIADLLPLIDDNVDVLGLTGGEPTLLGSTLADLLRLAARELPSTSFHVLTNGRRFADRAFVSLFGGLQKRVTWAIPLYADVSRIHDEVVGVSGAFAETMHGFHNLAEHGHNIELRTVLHRITLPRLTELCEYIGRNLPFLRHVAIMGLEPMGLARANLEKLAIDRDDIGPAIKRGVSYLHQSGFFVSLYNIPLCMLDDSLRPFARKSISDWKNEFSSKCELCALKENCCGFFRSSDHKWRDQVVRPQFVVTAA